MNKNGNDSHLHCSKNYNFIHFLTFNATSEKEALTTTYTMCDKNLQSSSNGVTDKKKSQNRHGQKLEVKALTRV